MKKALLSLIILFNFHPCQAQNYQCLQSGVKHYFINGNGYLRGIRIDSVRTLGDTTVYYPFHTPRGAYNFYTTYTLNPNGGSWLGKKVLQKSDGTFIFDSYWNDSVIIKTQANIGDSWVFYKDTSSLYYKATVIANDTMTILSSLDSVKTIMINAYNGSGIVTSDPLDSFNIILSNNNGFVQVFDLYTFPYHKPDSIFRGGLDYFLDRSNMPYYDWGAVYAPSKTYSIFNLTNFINPTQEQLYDWGLGDKYEYSYCYSTPYDCGYSGPYYYDTIKTKTVLAHSITYSTGVTTNDYTLLINEIPEEVGTQSLYYYFPNDNSFCMASPLYIISNLPNIFTTSIYTYKLGIGETAYDYEYFTEPLYRHYRLLCFNRYGATCGPCFLDVPSLSKNGSIYHIFPNPAADELTIKTSNPQPYTITLQNMMGQTIQTLHTTKQQETINVSSLPAGVYNVSITDEGGSRYNEKVVILH